MAESADKARAAVAKTFIKNTKAAAVAGSKDSQRAFLLLRKVAEKKAQVRQMTPAQRVEQVRAQAAAQRARKVAEDFYRQPATSGFLVAKGGRILRGSFVKKG
jgi:hypothetical protein